MTFKVQFTIEELSTLRVALVQLTDSPMHECKLPTLLACNKLTDSPTHQCNVSAVTMTVSIVASGSVRHTMLGLF